MSESTPDQLKAEIKRLRDALSVVALLHDYFYFDSAMKEAIVSHCKKALEKGEVDP